MAASPHVGSTEERFPVYGGSATRWGGQLLPHAPNDFALWTHVPHSGWPLNLAELRPHLLQCEQLLGVNDEPYDV